MRADHRAAANVQWRTNPFIHAQSFRADRGAYDIDNRVNGADFMEMNFLDVNIVNLCFHRAKRFKNPDGPIFRSLADGCPVDDLSDFLQPTVGMLVRVIVLMFMIVAFAMFMRVAVFSMTMFWVLIPCMAMSGASDELFPRQFLLPRGNHIYFGGADAAAVHP